MNEIWSYSLHFGFKKEKKIFWIYINFRLNIEMVELIFPNSIIKNKSVYILFLSGC